MGGRGDIYLFWSHSVSRFVEGFVCQYISLSPLSNYTRDLTKRHNIRGKQKPVIMNIDVALSHPVSEGITVSGKCQHLSLVFVGLAGRGRGFVGVGGDIRWWCWCGRGAWLVYTR